MSIRDYPGFVSGVTSNLPGDLVRRPVTDPVTKERQPVTIPCVASSRQTIRINDWMPTPLNRFTNQHWSKRKKAKDHDSETVALNCHEHGITPATRKLRVIVTVVLPKGKRACDPDAIQKSLGDALVKCGALKNDSHKWVEWAPVEFVRGERLTTFLTLEGVI